MNKKIIRICMMGLLLAVWMPLRAFAQGGDGFRLDSSGMVTLDSSHAAKEGISSVSFTLTVEPEGADQVGFEFAGDIAEIMEYYYDAEGNRLNVYIAGTDPLFPEGAESLSIGKVVVRDGSGKDRRAKVGVEEGSLQYVYGAEARTMEDVDIPEKVQVGPEGGSILTPPTTVTPPPADTSRPSEPQTPQQPANPSDGQENDGAGSSQPAGNQTAGGSSHATGVPRVPVSGVQVGSNSTGNGQGSGAQESSASQEETEPEVQDTPEPSEESTAQPEEPSEAESESSGSESQFGERDQSQGEGGFLKEMKPILIGLLIGAVLIGIGAVVVVYLIKPPKRK